MRRTIYDVQGPIAAHWQGASPLINILIPMYSMGYILEYRTPTSEVSRVGITILLKVHYNIYVKKKFI